MSSRSALSSVSSSSAAARRGAAVAAPALPSRAGLFGSSANASKRSLAVRPVAALATDNKPAVVKVSSQSLIVRFAPDEEGERRRVGKDSLALAIDQRDTQPRKQFRREKEATRSERKQRPTCLSRGEAKARRKEKSLTSTLVFSLVSPFHSTIPRSPTASASRPRTASSASLPSPR